MEDPFDMHNLFDGENNPFDMSFTNNAKFIVKIKCAECLRSREITAFEKDNILIPILPFTCKICGNKQYYIINSLELI